MSLQVVSQSAIDTQALGKQLGCLLEAGDIVCLYGELGSGKTVLSKGIARGLGVADEDRVRSPSFVLIHRYQGRVPMYHADLYRLDGPTDIADIGLREFLVGDGVAVIEWADKLEASLPSERLDIILAHQEEQTRLITVTPQGARYLQRFEQWLALLRVPGNTCDPRGDGVERASP
ncbi:MAG TPA: tRNA (adenosine(37)-N6)-threonylcarbamoyltransferase complex ATPase subunit type 1 TsaE [Candidatus Tectomicrobia bacterium]